MNRIRIIGGPGGGKTYASVRLSKILKIPLFSMDDIKWNNRSKNYNVKNSPKVRDRLLKKVLEKKAWILEGGYYDWDLETYKKAEVIIVIKPKPLIRDWRIITRYLKNKVGIEKGKRENLKKVFGLLKWNHEFEKEYSSSIEKLAKKYNKKVKLATSGEQAVACLTSGF